MFGLKSLFRMLTGLGTLALVLYLAWAGWSRFGPSKPHLGAARRQLVDQVVPQAVEDLRQARQDLRSALLLHLAGDPTDYVSDKLRATIEETGVLDLRDQSLGEKLAKALNLRVGPVADLDAALRAGQHAGVQAVLFGTVHTLESYPGGAKLDLQLVLARTQDKQIMMDKHFTKELASAAFLPAGLQEEAHKAGMVQRFLGWVLAVLLLPVFTISFIRAMVRKESNRANAGTLAIYTVADTVLACLMLGVGLGSWGEALLFLLFAAAAFGYNVSIMTFALRLEQ
jgi:hypothetical protein